MNHYREIFDKYYSQFDNSEYWIKYKYDHTMRVVEYAKQIAISLNLSDEDIELAELCGLFHDISRFKQWAEYQTFIDLNSFDHGDMGYEILKELGIENEIILISTKVHNKYEVPDDLDDRTKLFCNITRDADKVDILIDLANDADDDSVDIPEEVIEAFKNHTMVQNRVANSQNKTVKMLRCLAFIFNAQYKKTFELIKEHNVVNIKCDNILSKHDDDRIKEIKNILNNYIDERVK